MPQLDINAILDPNKTYKPEAIQALREFKKRKTYRDSPTERLGAMQELVNKLAEIYGVGPVTVTNRPAVDVANLIGLMTGMINPATEPTSGLSHADRETKTIHLIGKLSIITLLHEFAHLRFGENELAAQRWAVNLFRKVYKKQFAKLHFNGWAWIQREAPPEAVAAETE